MFRERVIGGLMADELVNWCFEPIQPQRVTSGLRLMRTEYVRKRRLT